MFQNNLKNRIKFKQWNLKKYKIQFQDVPFNKMKLFLKKIKYLKLIKKFKQYMNNLMLMFKQLNIVIIINKKKKKINNIIS